MPTNQAYDCKYNGADISQEDLATANCTTYAVKDQPVSSSKPGLGGTEPPFETRAAR